MSDIGAQYSFWPKNTLAAICRNPILLKTKNIDAWLYVAGGGGGVENTILNLSRDETCRTV